MFTEGELVTTLAGRVGVVMSTKVKFLNQYCRIMWIDSAEPEWVFYHNLLDVGEESK